MEYDAIVIGGGYAGLSIGAVLANEGHSVLLLEQAKTLGGRSSFIEKDGYTVEYGIHANRFASQGAAAELLRKVGKELEFKDSGEPMLWYDKRLVELPNNIPKIIKFEGFGFTDKLIAAKYLAKMVFGNHEKKLDISLDKYLGKLGRQEIKEMLSIICGLGIIAQDMKNASTGEFMFFLKKALKSKKKIGYPAGGTRQIIEKLSDVIESNDGKILTQSQAKKVVIKKGRVVSVQTQQSSYASDVVVSAIPLQQVPSLFGGKDLPIRFVNRVKEIVPTSGLVWDVALKESVTDISGLIVYPSPLIMGHVTSNIDASMAPEGKSLMTWFYPMPSAWIKNKQKIERETEVLKNSVLEMFPDIENNIEWDRMLAVPMVDGFLPKPGQTVKDRPGFSIEGLESFFTIGDVTHAEGTGGDTAFNSAIEAAPLILSVLK